MKIIVNADDFGLSQTRNKAVNYSLSQGICTQGSLIVNTPFSDEAVELAKSNGYADKLGLHINLTCSYPLSESIKRVASYCQDGLFVSTAPRSLRKVFSFKYVHEIREEIEAQILKFKFYGLSLTHIDAHHDILFNIPVWLAVKPLLAKYNIKSVRGIEPYLFGFYRKSILSYLPLKYYFKFCFLRSRFKGTWIMGGAEM